MTAPSLQFKVYFVPKIKTTLSINIKLYIFLFIFNISTYFFPFYLIIFQNTHIRLFILKFISLNIKIYLFI